MVDLHGVFSGSSHIILGYSDQREFVTLGAAFTQRLFRNRIWSLDYRAEVRPLMVESDPVLTGDDYNINLPAFAGYPGLQESGYAAPTNASPIDSAEKLDNTFTYNGQTYYQDYTFTYGRRWTYVAASAPRDSRRNFSRTPVSSRC